MKLSAKQQHMITAMLAHPSVKEACQAAQLSQATAFRWLQLRHFQEALQQARGQALQLTLTTLQTSSAEAVLTLRTVMQDNKAHPTARVSAARTVLEMTLKAREQFEIEARLQAIEQQIAMRGKRNET